MPGHQNKLIAETPSKLSSLLKVLHKRRNEIKESYRSQKNERQILSPEERRAILKKTAAHCHICGGTIKGKWDADHVMAHSGGGMHRADNYLPAHPLCNNYRWDYLAEEFQLILKIGIWCKREIERRTSLGLNAAQGFIRYEKRRLKRRKR